VEASRITINTFILVNYGNQYQIGGDQKNSNQSSKRDPYPDIGGEKTSESEYPRTNQANQVSQPSTKPVSNKSISIKIIEVLNLLIKLITQNRLSRLRFRRKKWIEPTLVNEIYRKPSQTWQQLCSNPILSMQIPYIDKKNES
jgi:hypothetical protein